MTRVILFLLLLASAVLVVASIRTLFNTAGFNTAGKPTARKKEDTMPETFRNVAYLLLIVLMVGVATGWLGSV